MGIGFRTYFVKQAFQNMRDNLGVHVLGLSTMISSLLIFGIFMLLYANVANWIHGWGNSLSFSVYLNDDISAYKRDKVDAYLRQLPGRKSLKYISKKEAMNDLKRALGEDAALMSRFSSNPLPASYEVLFDRAAKKNALDPSTVKSDLLHLEGVSEVQCSQEWLGSFDRIMGVVRIIFWVVGGLMCLCVVFIMTNTIKLTFFYRKSEVEILKLVGATDWFIKMPFLLEGIIQGILAGLLTLLMLGGAYSIFVTKEIQLLHDNSLDLIFLSVPQMGLLLSISVALGFIGSFIATSGFLKVK